MKNILYTLVTGALLLNACSNARNNSTNDPKDTLSLQDTAAAARDTQTAAAPAGTQGEVSSMEAPAENAKLEIRTSQTDLGWGYDILKDGKVYVHQPHIPAIAGNKGFRSEADAKRAGELVKYKIEHNIIPPSVTVQELDSIKVIH